MRSLALPSMLVMAPLALGCAASPDAGVDGSAAVDTRDDASPSDAVALDGPDAVEEVGVDIQFSERRVDVAPPDGALCITERNDLGAVVCREEGFPVGSGFLCLRYLCDADDGGASTAGCCRLVS